MIPWTSNRPNWPLQTLWWVAVFMMSVTLLARSSFTAESSRQECGKSIYLEGVDCGGSEIKSRLGDVELSGKAQACANCHGAAGKGASEGGVVAGDITWDHLTLPYGHTDLDGRKHPPFTKESFYRAVTQGVDPANHRLPITMPRFQLSRQQTSELADYLKSISSDFDPGLNATSIHLAILLPRDATTAQTGAVRETLAAYFADVDQAGSIYGRRVELHFVDTADTQHSLTQVRKLIEDREAFALLQPWGATAKEISELAEGSRIPLLSSDSLAGDDHQTYVFSLLPGASVEAAELTRFAAREKGINSRRAAVIFSSNELKQLQEPVEQAWRDLAVPPPAVFTYTGLPELLPSLVQRLQQQGTESVFFFGSPQDVTAFIQEAHRAHWAPNLFFAGSITGLNLGEVPAEYDQKIFVCSSASEEEPDSAAATQFRDFLKRHQLSEQFWLTEASAFASARVMEEGLRRAGRDLGREKLVASLESLHSFETGVLPPISFGSSQRVGVATLRIFEDDLAKKDFRLVRVIMAP
jgi:ABC-type branched-subunit amino acid transport system substrate-binding protein